MNYRDCERIKVLIRHYFGSMSWAERAPADWNGCRDDFVNEARIYWTSGTAGVQTVEEFLTHMKSLSACQVRQFAKRALGIDVSVFGRIAVAIIGNKTTENDMLALRGVEMALLVKSEDRWRIAALAREDETAELHLPTSLE